MAIYGSPEPAFAGQLANTIHPSKQTYFAKEEINFGATVWSYEGEGSLSAKPCYNYHLDVAKIVYSADFVTSNSIAFSVNGTAITAVVFATNHLTTITALRDAVTALTGIDAALDPADTNNRTLLVRGKGLDLTVTSTVTGGASQATATITYSSDQVFLGVAVHQHNAVFSYNVAKYLVSDPVCVLEEGEIWALKNGTVLSSSEAYVVASGANKGKFAASGLAVNSKFKNNGYTNSENSDQLAVVAVDGLKKPNSSYTWI